MAKPTAESRGISLGTRFFLATALLVILAVGASVLVTKVLGNQVGYRTAQKDLTRAGAIQSQFLDQRYELLGEAAIQMATDPNFSAYVVESLEYNDIGSILDQLAERQQELGFDFAILLDETGGVVLRTDRPGQSGDDMSNEALFEIVSGGEIVAGLWESEGEIYYSIGVPVGAGGLLAGSILFAYAIDDVKAVELRDLVNTEILYINTRGERPVASAKTLSQDELTDLLGYLQQHQELLSLAPGSAEQLQVELAHQQWLGQVRPLSDVSGEPLGLLVNLVSVDNQLAPFLRIGRILMAVGVIVVLLALVVSYFLPKRVLQPMSQLAVAAKRAAEGDYDQRIEVESRDEVGDLADAFNTLLSELREKRDMEEYVSQLARTVPETEGQGMEAVPAEERQITLMGLDLRDYAKGLASSNPAHSLELMTRDLRRFARAVSSQGGKVESLLGHRLVASFEGSRRADRALTAAADILNTSKNSQGEPRAALALVTGMVVSGTVQFDNHLEYVLTGPDMEELEGLLRVARAGNLLLSSTTRQELGSTFEDSGISPQAHRSTVSSLPLYSLDPAVAGRFASPELAATQDLATLGRTMDGARTLAGVGPGSLLGGRFEILSELGAGGMGVVYKARDRTLNELVALKMLKGDVWGDSDRLERLKDELKLARKIAHPNILRTFDFGEADGRPFISMEFVRGVTLRQLMDRSGRLPLTAGLRTARQLCRGLAAAHAESVLHRDIKPENLLIEHTGNAKLMDFGIARSLARTRPSQTEPGSIIGTPFYLAPEQLEGLEADQRADLYACGVVLYEIFTGQLPFSTQGTIFEIISRKLNEEPLPPSQHWKAMPQSLEAIIMRCLARNRDERYGDVETLLTELEVLRA